MRILKRDWKVNCYTTQPSKKVLIIERQHIISRMKEIRCLRTLTKAKIKIRAV